MVRGDIFFADLSPSFGSEIGEVRKVLVVSNNVSNRFNPHVTVSAITSQFEKAKLPTHVLIKGNTDLGQDCAVLLEHVRTIDKNRLKDKITHLDIETMTRVDTALKIHFGLNKEQPDHVGV